MRYKFLLVLVLVFLTTWVHGAVTVTCSVPAANTNYTSPVSFSCSATTGAAGITGWHIYIDNVDKYNAVGSPFAPSISTSIDMTSGTHTAIVRAWDSTGAKGDVTLTVVVQTASTVSVSVSAPLANSTVTSPVRFTASATTTGQGITGWKVYVDNVEQFSAGAVSSITTDIALSAGSHTGIVRAWNEQGKSGDQTIPFTVSIGTVTVNVTSPTTGNPSLTSPVYFAATATSSLGQQISSWHVFIDGVDSLQVNGTSLSENLAVSSGAHTAIIRAYDAGGASGEVTRSFSVSTGQPDQTYTTTLYAETSNNTSGASNFPGTSNENARVGNVSKVSVTNLLYSGNTTKMATIYQPWFDCTTISTAAGQNMCNGHITIGFSENDTAAVKRQMDDMISRGFKGVGVNYYGRGAVGHAYENSVTLKIRDYLDSLCTGDNVCSMTLFMQYDGGAFKWYCDAKTGQWQVNGYTSAHACVQAQINADMAYLNSNYFNHNSYQKYNTGPIVHFFITESDTVYQGVNWSNIYSTIHTNYPTLRFIFMDAGWSHASYNGNGGYAWVKTDSSNVNSWNKAYLDWINNLGAGAVPNSLFWSVGYAGFNDTMAGWSLNRIMRRQCGQVWLNSTAEAGNYFSTSKQLPYMLAATWNDYEEGSEIETGIDPCNVVTATFDSVAKTVNWSISGNQNTVDHFVVFSTQETTANPSLKVVQENIAASSRSLNLASYIPSTIGNGTWYFYVKAVMKNSMTNSTSSVVGPLTISSGGGGQPPVCNLSLSNSQGYVPATISASVNCYDPDGVIDNTVLVWGDGTSTTLSSPVTSVLHTYTLGQVYTVTVTATDSGGLTGSGTAQFTGTAITVSSEVDIKTPIDRSYVYSPVRISVDITAAVLPITNLQIQVDDLLKYEDVSPDSSTGTVMLDKYIFMSKGAWHRVTVSALDGNGSMLSKTVQVYCVGLAQ